MAALCQSAVSRSVVPLAATGKPCAGLPFSEHEILNPRSSALQLGTSVLPLPPSKAGTLSTVSRPASGYSARGSCLGGRALVTGAAGGFSWTSAASVRFESLKWKKPNRNTSGFESVVVSASQSSGESPIVENSLQTKTVAGILLQEIVAGPPTEVVPFVFGEVSDLGDKDSYLSYFLELLVSWEAYPGEFERVFWKTLKQQVTGTRQLRDFVANFLTDRETAVEGLTGSRLGRHFEGAFLEEGRSNPVTHQLDGLYDVFEKMGQNEYWVRYDNKAYKRLTELCEQFKAAREGDSRERLRIAAQFPREEPPWRTSRVTLLESGRVEQVALPGDAPSGKDSEAEAPVTNAGLIADGSDDPTGKNQPSDLISELRRGRLPAVAGHPTDVVPFVFGEASDLNGKEKEKQYAPLIKELLLSWDAFPGSFESVFWKILKQQTTGTNALKSFLAFFLTDRGVSVGNLTGTALQKQLQPRYLEEARFSPVSHQLDGLNVIIDKLLWQSAVASKGSGLSDFDALNAFSKEFQTEREKNETGVERLPREIPPWRLIASSAEQKSSASDD